VSALRSMPEPHFLTTTQDDDDDDTFGTTFSDTASQHAKPLLRECARGVGGGGGVRTNWKHGVAADSVAQHA